MRVCLVTHGFPPLERTGVEGYTAALAAALAAAGHTVEVFTVRADPTLPQRSLRRETRTASGASFAVTWLTDNEVPAGPEQALSPPGLAARFRAFLEAERPEVIHFQHVVKLGIELVDVARDLGVPTLYTAHDYFAICHRYTLLRPDLMRCDSRGDSMACARCDLALGWLNAKPEPDSGRQPLGDYQMGALPHQLGEAGTAALEAILYGEPEAAGLHTDALDAAFDTRLALDGLRARAFSRLDGILAPTKFLADTLVAGGVDRARIEVLPYGVEVDDLRDLPPIRADADAPLRFAFLGGLSKHKGVHVLLEAWDRLDVPAQLTIHGYSSDTVYVDELRARATEVGAIFAGPFERAELPAVLADVDVVVVPSIWVENQPLVIREAFAAGRPVITGDFGALPESVRDGVDGLLVAPDDPDALAAALARCVKEEGLVERLAAGIPPVHSVAGQARELVERYAALVERKQAEREAPATLASLGPFDARVAELEALPSRELFRRALAGIGRLRAGLGDDLSGAGLEQLVAGALAEGSRAQMLLEDARQESEWMRTTVSEHELARRELSSRVEWVERTMDGTGDTLASLEQERDWLREQIAAMEEELVYLREKSGSLEAALEDLRQHSEQLVSEVETNNTAQLALVALRAQEHAKTGEMRELLDELGRITIDPDASEEQLDESSRSLGAIGLDRIQRLETELAWRRDQMQAIIEDAQRGLVSRLIGRTGVGRRVQRWAGGVFPHGAPFPNEDDADSAGGEA
jgi:glycosyltransferase involved in cell wall biosynthesis